MAELTPTGIPDNFNNPNITGVDIVTSPNAETVTRAVPSGDDGSSGDNFKQLTFLGASIIDWNANGGFNEQIARLEVNLVADDQNSSDGVGSGSATWWLDGTGGDDIYHNGVKDLFSPPGIGTPLFFKYGSEFSTINNAFDDTNTTHWTFGGIFEGYTESESPQGKPLYSVSVTDPKDILDGIELVLDGFNGQVSGVPNLFNLFGYWEDSFNLGFGGSQVNVGGMLWTKARDAMNALMSFSDILPPELQQYGGRITFAGHNYRLDLSGLPALPINYRIGGGSNITLLGFIADLCEASNHDYFITLDPPATTEFDLALTGGTIVVNTIDKRLPPTFGAIQSFIDAETDAGRQVVTNNKGFELANNTTSKFLVGGNLRECFIQSGVYDVSISGEDQKIWHYWGVDSGNNAIIGQGIRDAHIFTLDSRLINVQGIDNEYTTNIQEMKYVLAGRKEWETFLSAKNAIGNEASNPQFGRADTLQIQGLYDVAKGSLENLGELLNTPADPVESKVKSLDNVKRQDEQKYNIDTIYEWLSSIANEFYGKKFMIRIPDVSSFVDPDTDEVIYTLEPSSKGGFIPKNVLNTAILDNILPRFFDTLQNQDGLFETYVRFDNAHELDLSEVASDVMEANILDGTVDEPTRSKKTGELDINGDPIFYIDPDWTAGEERYSSFIKCKIEPEIRFVNFNSQTDPRVVIELPSQVNPLFDGEDGEVSSPIGFIKDLLVGGFGLDIVKNPKTGEDYNKQSSTQDTLDYYKRISAGTNKQVGKAADSMIPQVVVVPLKSNVLTYGPWFSSGVPGKIEFEQSEDLVPWNYGGFDVMNLAALSKVSEISNNNQISEKGSIKVAAIPNKQLGEQLVANGPYVTNIRVSLSSNDISTDYTLQTWTPNFGKISRQNSTNIRKASKSSEKARKQNRLLQKELDTIANISERTGKGKDKKKSKAPTNEGETPDTFIIAEGLSSWENSPFNRTVDPLISSGTVPNTIILPDKDLLNNLGNEIDYVRRGGMSLDGLLRPFSTNFVNNIGSISNFVKPIYPYSSKQTHELASGDANFARTPEPTVFDLNPLASGHDVSYVIGGSGFLTDGIYIDSLHASRNYQAFGSGEQIQIQRGHPDFDNLNSDHQFVTLDSNMVDYRGVGFKTPMVFTGWGFDTKGVPTPASGADSRSVRGNYGGFENNHLTKSHNWKSGPLDLRWSEKRGVWTGGHSIKEGFLVEDLEAPTNADPTSNGISLINDSPDNIAISGYTTARVVACVGDGTDFSPLLVPDFAGGFPKRTHTIVNRDRNFSASSGDHILYIDLNDEWRPLAGKGATTSSRQTLIWEFTTYIGDFVAWQNSTHSSWKQITGFHYADDDLLGLFSSDKLTTDTGGEFFGWRFTAGYSNFSSFRKGKNLADYPVGSVSLPIAATIFSIAGNTFTGDAYTYNSDDGVFNPADVASNSSSSKIPIWNESSSNNLSADKIFVQDSDGNAVFGGTPKNSTRIGIQFTNTTCIAKSPPTGFGFSTADERIQFATAHTTFTSSATSLTNISIDARLIDFEASPGPFNSSDTQLMMYVAVKETSSRINPKTGIVIYDGSVTPEITQDWKRMNPRTENNTFLGQTPVICDVKNSTQNGQNLLLRANPGGTVTYDLYIRAYSADALANNSFWDIEFIDLT